MKKGRYMLIHMDRYIHRFKYLKRAKLYAIDNCQGSREFYIIIDTKTDRVVCRWYY